MGIAYAWFVPTSAPSLGPISVADKPLVGEGDTGAMFHLRSLSRSYQSKAEGVRGSLDESCTYVLCS